MPEVWVELITLENTLSVSRGPGLLPGQSVLPKSPLFNYSVPSSQTGAGAELDAAILGISATCAEHQ